MTNPFTLTIHMVSSLDGFIAKPDNSVAWFETTDVYERGAAEPDPAETLRSIDCYVMGSATYEHAAELSKSYGWVYGDKPAIVLTSRNRQPAFPNVEFYSGGLKALVDDRLKPSYKNVWAVGGAKLSRELLLQNLADEIRITILPIILGEGLPFFDHIGKELPLHLKDATAYRSGMAELWYEIKK